MKKIFIILNVILCSTLITLKLQAQINPGDTIYPIRLIDFDDSIHFISADTASQNIWQTGQPQKIYFNSAYSGSQAMVTDTVNNYPVNNYSYFDLYIGTFNIQWYQWDIFMDFKHKYDTDTLKDGGFITVSWDNGLTWTNIIHDTIYTQFGGSVMPGSNFMWPFSMNLYTDSNTLYNGEFGFSGKSNGWVHTAFSWHYIPVKSNFPPDTMIVRFNFISDNINHPKEGWMIDDIKLYSIDLGGGIHDIPINGNLISVSPNPMNSSASITLDKLYKKADLEVFDSKGNSVLHKIYSNCTAFNFEKNQLQPGIYNISVCLDGNIRQSKKIIIIP